MSTSFPNENSSSNAPTSRGLSLRGLLLESVFVGAEDVVAHRCVDRADRCRPGDVFIPRNTAASDEHDKAEEAIKRGAVAIVAERVLPVSVPQCLVENTQEAYGLVCQALAGNPSKRMLTVGVVGTYAKTTTSLYVASMLKRLGGAVAYCTSLGTSDSTACDRTATKPPGAKRLANWLQRADQAGSPAAVIEISPSMLNQYALAGVEFDLLIVPGLRPGQFRGNPNSKTWKRLLSQAAGCLASHGLVLYNADDSHAQSWIEGTELPRVSYGLDAAEDVRGKRLSRLGGGQQILASAGNLLMPLTLNLPGDHVARAALAAVAAAYVFDLSVPEAIAGVEALDSVPGRMQRVQSAVEVPLYIDEGESPDRVATTLHALRQHQLGPTTVVIDLSNRLDPNYRSRLGEVLDKAAERVVLTSADLSPEACQSIAMDVLGGFKSPGTVQVIPDRSTAIRWAVDHTEVGSILLAGCGVDNWVDRNGEICTDESIAKDALSQKNTPVTFPQLSIFPPPSESASQL